MEEERQITETVNFTTDATKTYAFSSQFKVEFDTELQDGAEIELTPFLESDPATCVYTANELDLSRNSGLFELFVWLEEPVATDTTIDGTVTLNDYEIPVSGTISEVNQAAFISDDTNGWWTVFGSIE